MKKRKNGLDLVMIFAENGLDLVMIFAENGLDLENNDYFCAVNQRYTICLKE